MKIFDISVPIHNEMAVWPGDPSVNNHLVTSIKTGDEANVTFLQMSAHTGTHVDAPKHYDDFGIEIDRLDLDHLMGEVEVIEIEKGVEIINEEVLQGLEKKIWSEKVIFKTNNTLRNLLHNAQFIYDFVALSADAAEYLINMGVRLVGIDYLSIGPFENGAATHKVLLEKKIIVLEGLNLSEIHPGKYHLIALPIKMKGADGAPARVILIKE